MRLPFARDVWAPLAILCVLGVSMSYGVRLTQNWMLEYASYVVWTAAVFMFVFFRDPDRNVPDNPNLILSPADGRVVKMARVMETDYFGREVTQVSVFLSVLNVHINRIPLAGKVDFYRYQKGRFHAALWDKASEENEQTVIGIKGENTSVLFKQIAGVLARRIVCHIREGHTVAPGERFGLIKFGSRVDMFLPDEVEVLVKKGQKLKGGEAVIGETKHVE